MSDLISRQDAIDALNKKRIETMEKGKDVNLIWECLDVVAQLPFAQQWIPFDWLEEKLTNHPELPYAVTDGIIAVLELWNNECGARMDEGGEE